LSTQQVWTIVVSHIIHKQVKLRKKHNNQQVQPNMHVGEQSTNIRQYYFRTECLANSVFFA